MAIKYLYGASVHGIQSFIFQTNKLKEIIGASNLVEKICTTMFKPYSENARLIIGAAGNIKCIFTHKQDCEKAVLEFKERVLKEAPGITMSQAVVEYDESTPFSEVIEKLEAKLRIQRNKVTAPTLLGAIGIKRSRQTGLPAMKYCDMNEAMDDSTYHKLCALKDTDSSYLELARKFYGPNMQESRIPYDIESITKKNTWVAVIHADGNGLGQVVMKLGVKETEFSEFSKKLNQATISAASGAFASLDTEPEGKYPIRPVVLGGDDLTVICRGDLAIPFCNNFLSLFKQKTKDALGDILTRYKVFEDADYLTACAGITFIKSSFPFFYGYELAEDLCRESKKVAKSNRQASSSTPSCLMFHKVQDSFIRDYNSDISKRELAPQMNVSWKFGPYFLEDEELKGYWSIDALLDTISSLDELQDTGLRSSLREWINAMHRSESEASQRLERITEIIGLRSSSIGIRTLKSLTKPEKRYGIGGETSKVYPTYDTLALYTITFQEIRG